MSFAPPSNILPAADQDDHQKQPSQQVMGALSGVRSVIVEDEAFFPMDVPYSPSNHMNRLDVLDPSLVADNAAVEEFRTILGNNKDMAMAVAAIQTLTSVARRSKATTLMELLIELRKAADDLKQCRKSSISLAAGCDLFLHQAWSPGMGGGAAPPSFQECKRRIIERGDRVNLMSQTARDNISELVNRFIRDRQVILIHGYSRVVLTCLLKATQAGKRFSVVVTECRQGQQGVLAVKRLSEAGIPVTLILDSAIGYVMEKIDLVLLGAEGVVETGGIINALGTYPLAILAHTLKKPVYVAVEAFKFARSYPLQQSDTPDSQELQFPIPKDQLPENVAVMNPSVDYTPPNYLTLLFTNLGILTPSAVSDELIKLYR